MKHDVLFVHGTGVRGDEFRRTLQTIAGQAVLASCRVQGCLWGDDLGCRPGQGLSVPLYDQSKALGDEVDPVQAWAQLLQDPMVELTLAAQARLPPGAAQANPFAAAPSVVARLPLLAASLATPQAAQPMKCADFVIEGSGLAALVESAAELRNQPGLRATLESAALAAGGAAAGAEFAALLAARAITAGWLMRLHAQALAMPAGDVRDALVAQLATALGAGAGQSKSLLGGLKSAFLKPLSLLGSAAGGGLLRAGAWGSRKYRKSIADAANLRVGDILLYQARGQEIRDRIAHDIVAIGGPVVVIAHSLGGIACVDLLMKSPALPVRGLVTVGSQAPYLYEIGALWSRLPHEGLVAGFPPWLNVYDPDDLLSFMAAPMFPAPARVTDVQVKSGQPFPISHGAYWTQPAVWQAYKEFIDGLHA